MRTTFAAEPRHFDWHYGINTKPYAAQPFPPIAWECVPARGPIKWCDGVFLTWASKHEDPEKPAANANVGFLAERLGHGVIAAIREPYRLSLYCDCLLGALVGLEI